LVVFAVPIDLTLPGEPHRSRNRHRRRGSRDKLRAHSFIAVGIGLAALGGLALFLYLSNNTGGSGRIQAGGGSDFENSLMSPKPPVSADKAGAPPEVLSAPAESSDEPPEDVAKVKLIALSRIRATDMSDQLQLQYEFFKNAKGSGAYVIAIRMPGTAGITYASFGDRAPMKDTAILPVVLSRIGNRGPIQIWIETIVPAGERVSNILTLK
jgi:hypothetical protein